jgi:hypothetical protein
MADPEHGNWWIWAFSVWLLIAREIRHGDFAYLPARHVHRATCLSAAPCLVFLTSDAAFDIHWVDATGQDIPLEAALKAAKSAKTPHGNP